MLKTPHAAKVTVRREIAATADELFDAWLDPQSLATWMRPGGITRSVATVDARVGGAYEILMHTASGVIRHTGTYVEIARPRRLVFTWASPGTYQTDSLVTVEFVLKPHSTEVVLTHERLPDDQVASHTGGWTDALVLLDKTLGRRPG